ncbi:hypothetical protein [Bifidobacterium platyrrhinorum]|uniref:Uncharacterized protein n=1 Tax=Bifidobacterium platyrrhinorum TaxID=2661628 RepID=A0A6L9SS84_9BIFI|nr:hypothetical protein [Bifidobacterium platyrrhinorum]NEG55410.1 hypothetical protein [Bifidobacterium platyrrhinorum]
MKNKKAYGYNYADLAATVEYIDLNYPQYEYRQSVKPIILGDQIVDYAYTIIRPKDKSEPWSEPLGLVRVVPGGMPEKKKLTPQQQYDAALTTASRISLQRAFGRASEDNDTNELRQPVDNIQEVQKQIVMQDWANRIGVMLQQDGIKDGDRMLAKVSEVIGRKLTSIYQITPAEAERFVNEYKNTHNNKTHKEDSHGSATA